MANPSITVYQTNAASSVQNVQKTFNVKIGKNYSAARGDHMADTDTVNISQEGRKAAMFAASAANDLPSSQETFEAENDVTYQKSNQREENIFQQSHNVSVQIAVAAKTAAEAKANAAAQAAAEAKAAAGQNTHSAAAAAAQVAAAAAQNAAAAYAIAAARAANAERNAAYS